MPTPRSPRSSSLPTPPLPKARARSNHRPNNPSIFIRFHILVSRKLLTAPFSITSTHFQKHTGVYPTHFESPVPVPCRRRSPHHPVAAIASQIAGFRFSPTHPFTFATDFVRAQHRCAPACPAVMNPPSRLEARTSSQSSNFRTCIVQSPSASPRSSASFASWRETKGNF